ncbi:MAG TPA: hypothetical protein VD838_23070 [Anaeromyxobacteraceae bacterium]|nr:hypothetical protein [Anaeromyxobacteraceae bacterium]
MANQARRFEVLYRREPTFLPDPTLTVGRLRETHKPLCLVIATDLDDVFRKMQGEFWSPRGEMRPVIERLGLHHTSMSVGDVVYDPGLDRYFEVDVVGFREIGRDAPERTT